MLGFSGVSITVTSGLCEQINVKYFRLLYSFNNFYANAIKALHYQLAR